MSSRKLVAKMLIAVVVFSLALAMNASALAKTEIRWSFWGDQTELNIAAELKKAFEAKNPDISVVLEQIPSDQYEQKIMVETAAGQAPDVQIAREASFSYFANRGLYLDLTPYLRQARYDLTAFYPAILNHWKLNGKLYALPREFTPVVLYYNRDAFDRAGIAYPNENWTWDDFVKAAKKLTVTKDGKTVQWGTFMVPWDALYLPLIFEAGGQLISKDGSKAMLTSKPVEDAFQFAKDLIYKYHVAPPLSEANSYGWINGFAQQKFAMIFQGRWATPTYQAIKDFHWDVAPMPHEKKRATVLYTTGFAVSKQTRAPKEAARLVMFLASTEAQKTWGGPDALVVPANRSVAESSNFITPAVEPEHDEVFLSEASKYGVLAPQTLSFSQFYQILNRHVNEIFLNLKSVHEGLSEAEQEINQMLAKLDQQVRR